MQKMLYKSKPEVTLLDNGVYNGISYAIVSLGTHPSCYLGVYNVDWMEDFSKVPCHWGINYEDIGIPTIPTYFINKKVIGWSYDHMGDHHGMLETIGIDGKKWTTPEMLEDVRKAIDYIMSRKR